MDKNVHLDDPVISLSTCTTTEITITTNSDDDGTPEHAEKTNSGKGNEYKERNKTTFATNVTSTNVTSANVSTMNNGGSASEDACLKPNVTLRNKYKINLAFETEKSSKSQTQRPPNTNNIEVVRSTTPSNWGSANQTSTPIKSDESNNAKSLQNDHIKTLTNSSPYGDSFQLFHYPCHNSDAPLNDTQISAPRISTIVSNSTEIHLYRKDLPIPKESEWYKAMSGSNNSHTNETGGHTFNRTSALEGRRPVSDKVNTNGTGDVTFDIRRGVSGKTLDPPIAVQMSRRVSSHLSTPIAGFAERCGMNLATVRGRRCNAVMILAMAIIPIMMLTIQNCINLYDQTQRMRTGMEIKKDIAYTTLIGDLIHTTQIERGTTILYLGSQDKTVVNKRLEIASRNTDQALQSLTKWLSDGNVPHFATRKTYKDRILEFRANLTSNDPSRTPTVKQALAFWNNDNAVIQRWIAKTIRSSTNSKTWRLLVSYDMLVYGKEQTGVERATGVEYFAETTTFSFTQMNEYVRRKVLSEEFLEEAKQYCEPVRIYLDQNETVLAKFQMVKRMRRAILQNVMAAEDDDEAELWLQTMTDFIDMLKDVQDMLVREIFQALEDYQRRLSENVYAAVVIMIMAVLLLLFVALAVYRLTGRIQTYADELRDRTIDLDIEMKRSEMLLFELLPIQVAKKLLNNEKVPPQSYRVVSIYFSDIVGFTWICSKSTPMQVIDMLNSLYQVFDDIISNYNVYKVETIGDAYMVASGLPEENPDGHATEMAGVALDMRDNISNMRVPHLPDKKIQLRIGVHAGPVVAGVVGHKMPRYCLFGDSVNTASRMESTSLPFQIQVSESFKRELQMHGGFIVTLRGKTEVKGKGVMTTYWLVARSKRTSDENEVIETMID